MSGDFVVDNSSYDAAYLDLAIKKGLTIASLDKAIVQVAKSLNIFLEE